MARAMRPAAAALTLTLAAIALITSSAFAADLDFSFGAGGKVITDVSGRYDEIRAVIIQPDGRIIAAGVAGTAPNRDFAVARYNTDGSLDRAFGMGGTVITDFAGGDDVAWALAIQLDGKIVVAGAVDLDFALARYNTDGSLDSQFGIAGKSTLDFGGDDRARALTIQADGKIVTAGIGRGLEFALARFDVSGTPDRTFGVDGRVTTDFSGRPSLGAAFPRALLVEPGLGLLSRDDGEDLDLRFSNVIKHPDVVDAQSVLRLP